MCIREVKRYAKGGKVVGGEACQGGQGTDDGRSGVVKTELVVLKEIRFYTTTIKQCEKTQDGPSDNVNQGDRSVGGVWFLNQHQAAVCDGAGNEGAFCVQDGVDLERGKTDDCIGTPGYHPPPRGTSAVLAWHRTRMRCRS